MQRNFPFKAAPRIVSEELLPIIACFAHARSDSQYKIALESIHPDCVGADVDATCGRLKKDGFLREVTDEWQWTIRYALTAKGFAAVAKKVSPQDIFLISQRVKKTYWQASPFDSIQVWLLACASSLLRGEEMPSCSNELSQRIDDYFASGTSAFHMLVVAELATSDMGKNVDWSKYLRLIPQNIALRPALFSVRSSEDGLQICSTIRKPLLDSRMDPLVKGELDAWFVFYADFLVNGHPAACAKIAPPNTAEKEILAGIVAMLENRPTVEAVNHMRQALKLRANRRLFDFPIENWFYVLSLFRDRANIDSWKKLKLIANTKKFQQDDAYAYMLVFAAAGTDLDINATIQRLHVDTRENVDGGLAWSLFFLAARHFGSGVGLFCNQWIFSEFLKKYPIFLLEIKAAVGKTQDLAGLEAKWEMKPLLPVFVEKPQWERLLDRLISAEESRAKKIPQKSDKECGMRIAYFVDTQDYGITMKLQKAAKSGGWSKGTDITTSAFHKGVEGMTKADLAVQRTLVHPYGYQTRWIFNRREAVLALTGNPNVFDANNPSSHIEVVQERLQISVKQKKNGEWKFETNLPAEFDPNGDPIAIRHLGGRLVVMKPTADEISMLLALQEVHSCFPAAARTKLVTYLESLSKNVPVMSDLLAEAKSTDRKQGDAKTTFRIEPREEGDFSVTALVRPIAQASVVCSPGKGLDFLAASVAGKTVQVVRDRKTEEKNFQNALQALEPLEHCRRGDYKWVVGFEDCLLLLEILRAIPNAIEIEWPQGVRFTVTKAKISTDALKLSLRRMGQWFAVEGKVKLDAKTSLSIAELLERIRESNGDFIRLGEAEYVALTESLKKQLSLLESLSAKSNLRDIKVSVFNAGMLEDLGKQGVHLQTDEAFRTITARIRASKNLIPVVPKTLKAELRDYQIDGYEWLSRLTSWGAGALLADDMGLGKTIQTIALLLSRRGLGPSLVVMPTSVLFNWADELRRFAPSLHVTVFNHAEDRASVVHEAAKGDVILVTYGVLAGDIDLLKTRDWASIILDEAHTIKNRDTKMSKAAMQLQSEARVLLTGTPLQNHLSELWNLFEFANPGLLGSWQDFSERFVIPVEKNRDRNRQRLLKRLISPFILRRTKAEVLDELPKKTEITLRVALSQPERALYENLREKAEINLETGRMNPIEALAELTKLRQAACNPQLVDSQLTIESSKTRAFLELVDDLIEGGHRALVFSQFTSHLALIRKALDERKIPYHYLDGSMSSAQRLKQVDEFQHSSRPLFLISLKAGGTGLNLTAADFVIHLDPWWNPAIEDQASDRAYRIGQENPVTIYRLIAENTIEEKILKLHESKKSLADALLEGADVSSRLSRDEILKLLSVA